MRVIAGSRKGHKLAAPRGLDTRPTSDRVRENIFNLVGPVDDARVLDLFAGSGALAAPMPCGRSSRTSTACD
jgi:16S rRNA (guanine966-N2)-methyltransferase